MMFRKASQFLSLGTKFYCPFRRLSSVPLSYIKIGDVCDTSEPPLLIFHGLFGNKNNWKSIGNQISNRTRNLVYSFDLRNHGESPHVDGDCSDLQAMANDIFLFMDNENIPKANILGHSLGGRVASQFAFEWPERVNKLIIVDITPLNNVPKIDFLTEKFFDELRTSIDKLPPNIDLASARKLVGELLSRSINNKFIVDFFLLNLYKDQNKFKWRFNVDALETLINKRLINSLKVKQPFDGQTMLIYGTNSPYVNKEDYNQIKEKLSRVHFVPIRDTGHYLHVEKTNEFVNHVVNFLR